MLMGAEGALVTLISEIHELFCIPRGLGNLRKLTIRHRTVDAAF